MDSNQLVKCSECGAEKPIEEMYLVEGYDTPWDAEPRTFYVCREAPAEATETMGADSCLDLLEDASWADFRYFTCPVCGRVICQQNPANGWMVQYRLTDDEMTCLRCYQEDILKNGMPLEDFEDNRLGGMFFSGDNHEQLEAGYREIPGFTYTFVSSIEEASRVCNEACVLISAGYKVIVSFERMAIGGGEGYITLWAKRG